MKLGALRAAILSGAPVRGLRPLRAVRSVNANVPKPMSVTVTPLVKAFVMLPVIAKRADLSKADAGKALNAMAYCAKLTK